MLQGMRFPVSEATPLTPPSPAVSALSAVDETVGLGWQPDLPDFRDYTLEHDKIAERLKAQQSMLALGAPVLPEKVDNRGFCSPVDHQGRIGSCTAQAVVSAMEYMMRRGAKETHVEGSRLFVYKVARKLLGWDGDKGCYLRTAMQAIAMFGMPPEEFWPYDPEKIDEEPTAFLYSFAANYQALDYTRLDPKHKAPAKVLDNVKQTLAAGYPVVFGFSVYSSLGRAADIPLPAKKDRMKGGHAVMAVGYDDKRRGPDGRITPSLIIRNSWGRAWGENGYGYLPQDYITNGLAQDFWTIMKSEWIDTNRFL